MAKRRRGNGQGTLIKRGGSSAWLARWYDHEGKRRERSTRTTDKAVAQRMLTKWTTDATLRREGVIDARKDKYATEGRKLLTDHVSDYITHCRRAGQDTRHVDQKKTHLYRLMDTTGATRMTDLTADALERHMAVLLNDGLSARTANFARQIAVAFSTWCVRTGRSESNPLKVVPKQDETKDRRLVRRPLTDDELARLLSVAQDHGRKAWYLTAVLAGLRKGDLQRLRWCDIDFDASTITIEHGKAKRTDVIPMHRQLAEELKRRHDESMTVPKARVFPQTVTDVTRLKDFLRAGLAHEEVVTDINGNPVMIGKGSRQRPKTRIVTEDAEGRVIDLHAMRTTLGTNLARYGATQQSAQSIMRHADYRTTLKHYTVLGLTDTAQAIDQLPDIGPPATEAAQATGTDDSRVLIERQQYRQQRKRESAQSGATPRGEHCHGASDADERNRPARAAVSDSTRQDATMSEPRVRVAQLDRASASEADNPTFNTLPSQQLQDADQQQQQYAQQLDAESPNIAPDLQHLITAWPDLPDAVRVGITAMVQATTR